ncbi:hypothetical protein [Mucilaginibacter sp.]|uniref:hypothetical protein n=1 Tax=Mucilaginibacter sp. TaxID=1882438 RepID=UPI0025F51174|nr:hypothetical protein [Mucilaginibacter sp.]
MTVISENELNKAIGKNGFFVPKTSLLCTQYAGGIGFFDSLIEAKSIMGNAIPTNIYLRPSGVEISIMHRFKLQKVGISFNDIVSVHIEDKETITQFKEKSVIGRALIGGLLLGPIGAIIGGMTGIGKKEVVVFEPDLVMTITYIDDKAAEKVAVFTADYGKKSKLYNDAKAVFGSRLQP